MEEDTPPKPPDPHISRVQAHDACDASRQSASSRKRPAEQEHPSADSGKKTVTDPSQGTPSIQNVYTHSSFAEGPKSYSRDDKGPFIVHVARETPDLSAGVTIRPLKFGQFLHTNKFTHINNDGVKSVGRNKISVEFSTAQAANEFLNSPILTLTKYKTLIPTFNITRMGLVRGVPVD